MYKCVLVLLLLPVTIKAQVLKPVEPVISNEYIELIKNSLVRRDSLPPDTTNNTSFSEAIVMQDFANYWPVKSIVIKNKKLLVKNSEPTRFALGGNYLAAFELKHINKLPALQNTYVQGRPINGSPAWQGAETNELFSYGPAINLLEFDGTSYPFDQNGKLVAAGTGSGKQGAGYDNKVFQTAKLFSQSFKLMGNLYVKGLSRFNFNLLLAESNEQTFIRANQNYTKNITASMGAVLTNNITLTASYRNHREHFTKSNRNGFLNRVYKNSILTPVSFNNAEGAVLATRQRSYSNLADNPEFLLQNNGNGLVQSRENAAFSVEKKFKDVSLLIAPTYERSKQSGTEKYKAGTANFPAGIATERTNTNESFQLKANVRYNIRFNSEFNSLITANYIFNHATSSILYSHQASAYNYRRNSNDYFVGLLNSFDNGNVAAGLDLTNKAYASNTALRKSFFLPTVSGYLRYRDYNYFTIKMAGTYSRFNSELPINQSYGYLNLLRLNTSQSQQYFPTQEADNFNNLLPRQHIEWSGKLEIWFKMFSLNATYFVRETKNDIFPIFTGSQLQLKNLADHRTKGVEIELSQTLQSKNLAKFSVTNSLGFTAFTSKVTHVADTYNYSPVAGFSNVHKAVVEGQALGSIVGSTWLRDGNGNRIIGTDGFPLADNQLKVIGNPIPDFVMKLSNTISWKNLSLSLDWEWRKGGDIWNGTKAALDYYGRSQQSAELRNTSNYIFEGVLEDGHVNNIPVSFYDAGKPLESNRWVRYGLTGVAEDYIEKGDQLRLYNATVSYKIPFKKYIQRITIAGYVSNILLWSPYKGADSNQFLFVQSVATGLDFFNLPSTRTTGLSLNIQF